MCSEKNKKFGEEERGELNKPDWRFHIWKLFVGSSQENAPIQWDSVVVQDRLSSCHQMFKERSTFWSEREWTLRTMDASCPTRVCSMENRWIYKAPKPTSTAFALREVVFVAWCVVYVLCAIYIFCSLCDTSNVYCFMTWILCIMSRLCYVSSDNLKNANTNTDRLQLCEVDFITALDPWVCESCFGARIECYFRLSQRCTALIHLCDEKFYRRRLKVILQQLAFPWNNVLTLEGIHCAKAKVCAFQNGWMLWLTSWIFPSIWTTRPFIFKNG